MSIYWASFWGSPPVHEFGDSFGSISALFSGLAIAGLVISLALQRDDFDQSIEELKKQNKLMADSMALNVFPTVLAQKLRYLSESHYIKEKNWDLDSVTENKIISWIEMVKSAQMDPVDRGFLKFRNECYAQKFCLLGILQLIDNEFRAFLESDNSNDRWNNVAIDNQSALKRLKHSFPSKPPIDSESILKGLKAEIWELNEDMSLGNPNQKELEFRAHLAHDQVTFFYHNYAYAARALRAMYRLDLSESVLLMEFKMLFNKWEATKIILLDSLLEK
ncbi:hypothetical protein N9O85_02380 [Porticoccaceae bacterium]|nr:hypothetical protein [Porticoccaceae bacterium]